MRTCRGSARGGNERVIAWQVMDVAPGEMKEFTIRIFNWVLSASISFPRQSRPSRSRFFAPAHVSSFVISTQFRFSWLRLFNFERNCLAIGYLGWVEVTKSASFSFLRQFSSPESHQNFQTYVTRRQKNKFAVEWKPVSRRNCGVARLSIRWKFK